MMHSVYFKRGSLDIFESINKDSNTIYFISDGDGVNQIYLGDVLYGTQILTDINAVSSDVTVFSSAAVNAGLNKKVDKCTLHTITDTTLPTAVTLNNNSEYRYLSLSGATTLNVSFSNMTTDGLFYSSVVLHEVSTNVSIADFVTVDSSSQIQNIVFLNGDFDLSDSETAEFLFFSNGMTGEICCIGYGYKVETPL